ncbi:MAG: hypothetical protein ABIQ66_03800 [Novosphingobium sp.]
MRKIALALAATGVLFAAPLVQARERLTPAAQLDKLLAGRVPGKPVHCISLMTSHDMQIIDKTAIVFGSGNVIYVNRPRYPESLDSDDVMVTKTSGSELCSLDIVRMHDRQGFWQRGFVGLSDFVPYRRVRG